MARRKTKGTRRTVRRSGKTISVLVGNFGSEPRTIRVSEPAAVATVLEAAGITVTGSQRIWLNGSRATPGTRVHEGDVVSVIAPREAGR